MESTNLALDRLLEKTDADCEFVLEEFSILQRKGSYGDWFSNSFSVGGYEFKLDLETRERGPNMQIRLYPKSDRMCRSATFVVVLQLLNQLGNHSHYSKEFMIELNKGSSSSYPYDFISFQELYRRDKTVQYLKEDRLKLHMRIKKLEWIMITTLIYKLATSTIVTHLSMLCPSNPVTLLRSGCGCT